MNYKGNRGDINYKISSDISSRSQFSPQIIKAIDGGVFANDPSMFALTEACELYPNADEIYILNIGTGTCNMEYNPKSLISWATAIPDIMINNTMKTSRHTIKELGHIYNKKVMYSHLNLNILPEHAKMDDIDSMHKLFNMNTYSDIDLVIENLRRPKTSNLEIQPNGFEETLFEEI